MSDKTFLPAYDLCDDAGGVRLIVTGIEAALREAPACTCDHEDTVCSDTCRSPLHALRHYPPAPRGWEVAETSVEDEPLDTLTALSARLHSTYGPNMREWPQDERERYAVALRQAAQV